MEDVLRIGGQYNSEKFSKAVMVTDTQHQAFHETHVLQAGFYPFMLVQSKFSCLFWAVEQDYCATKWSTLKQRLEDQLFSQQADISRLK